MIIEQNEMVARDAAGHELRMTRTCVSASDAHSSASNPLRPFGLNPLAYDPSDGVTAREVAAFTVGAAIEGFSAGASALVPLVVGLLRIVAMDLAWPIAREVIVAICDAIGTIACDLADYLRAKGLETEVEVHRAPAAKRPGPPPLPRKAPEGSRLLEPPRHVEWVPTRANAPTVRADR